MQWHERWRALSVRIEGVLQVADFFRAAYDAAVRIDHFNLSGKSFLPEVLAIDQELKQ